MAGLLAGLTMPTIDQTDRLVDQDTLERLRTHLQGGIALPHTAEYDEARQIWNAMIDRRPGLIVRCASAADILTAVRFARDHRLLTAIRAGGHNIAGSAVCDDGLMIDLSPMRSVQVDPDRRTAKVAPGATLAEFDRAAQAFGLATPLGINSTTGVAGLTLGGGFGWLSRKHGMTVDNLLSVDLVTATGVEVHASAEEHPDLFWAIRGGGGNFGVVTSFEFALHPVGPEIYAGLIVHPLAQAGDLLRHYREFAASAPDDLSSWVVLRKAPPLPFLPPEVHGKEVLVFAVCHAGDPGEGERAVAPLLALGQPVGSHLGPMPYTAWQSAFDPLLTPGARNYWKSHNFRTLSDPALDLIVQYAGQLPSPHSEIFLAQLGGAAARMASDATAYPHRDIEFGMNVHTRWEDPADDQRCIDWARRFFDATAPHATGGVYVNFISAGEERVMAAYGGNYDRLAEIKRRYDPDNLFRLNQNIAVTEGERTNAA